jgi:hypothetical protein
MEVEDDHSHASSIEIKNRWNYQYTFTPLRLQDEHRGNFISATLGYEVFLI